MLYDIALRMSYAFGEFTASGSQILRVLPKDLPGVQRVVVAHLDFQPRPSWRVDSSDFFGNAIVHASHQNVQHELCFTLQARVRRDNPHAGSTAPARLSDLGDEIAAYRCLDACSPHHFLGPSPRISRDEAIAAYARALSRPDMPVVDNIMAIANALHRDIAFDPEATDVKTPAGVAFTKRKGVCQDFTHIMITALRSMGIPAGYVSGFLRTIPPEGEPRLEGADAMHAWVMTWCGAEAGWIEIDPTNNMQVATDHIVVAMGRDYHDVAPVSGILKTAGSQKTEQAVDVIAVSERS